MLSDEGLLRLTFECVLISDFTEMAAPKNPRSRHT